MAFTVNLYTISDDRNKLSKSLGTPTSFTSYVLKEQTNVINPVLRIQTDTNLAGFNYVFIERYGRYYFIEKIDTTPTGLWILSCKCDVLMSFRTQIRALKGTVTRGEKLFNGYLNDPEYKAYAYTETIVRKFPQNFEGTDALILLTVG